MFIVKEKHLKISDYMSNFQRTKELDEIMLWIAAGADLGAWICLVLIINMFK